MFCFFFGFFFFGRGGKFILADNSRPHTDTSQTCHRQLYFGRVVKANFRQSCMFVQALNECGRVNLSEARLEDLNTYRIWPNLEICSCNEICFKGNTSPSIALSVQQLAIIRKDSNDTNTPFSLLITLRSFDLRQAPHSTNPFPLPITPSKTGSAKFQIKTS